MKYGRIRKMRVLFALLVVLFGTNSVYAGDIKNVSGKVTKVQLMGTHYLPYSTAGEAIAFIYMDELPVACDNSNAFRRVAITSSHPAFNMVVSTALAAKSSGASIDLHYLNVCTLWNSNAWDFAIINLR